MVRAAEREETGSRRAAVGPELARDLEGLLDRGSPVGCVEEVRIVDGDDLREGFRQLDHGAVAVAEHRRVRAERELGPDRIVEFGDTVPEGRDPQRRDRVEVAPAVDVDQVVPLGALDDDRVVVGVRGHLGEAVPHDRGIPLQPLVVRLGHARPILTHNGGGDLQRDPLAMRDRLLEATYTCVARYGMAKTTIEDVVKVSGVSRATIYRQFPGGRDELLQETVAWAIARYFVALGDQVRDAPDLSELLARGLVYARRSIREHEVLNKILDTEPERLLPLLSTESTKSLPFIASFLMPYLEREAEAGRLREGVDIERAADYLARGILSLIGSPGRWDLDDEAQVRALVADELLGGIIA